jgi:solute carrier family 36 (proton-coupled amino acid transporter)
VPTSLVISSQLFNEFTSFHASALTWALIIFPPMVLLNFTRTLQRIALLNSVGNLFMFSAYGIIFYVSLYNYWINPEFRSPFQHLLQPPHQTSQLPWVSTPTGVMTACGTILYCFEGQAMVLPLENKMRRPAQMLGPFGVLSTGMALTAIFDAAVGFLGYSKFGEDIQGSVTLNLPITPLLTCVKLVGGSLGNKQNDVFVR